MYSCPPWETMRQFYKSLLNDDFQMIRDTPNIQDIQNQIDTIGWHVYQQALIYISVKLKWLSKVFV